MNNVIISKVFNDNFKLWILNEDLFFSEWYLKIKEAIKIKDKEKILKLYHEIDLSETLYANYLSNEFQNTIFEANQILFKD